MSLSNKTLANAYKDLLQMDNSNNGITTSTKTIKDGEGTDSALSLSLGDFKSITADADTGSCDMEVFMAETA